MADAKGLMQSPFTISKITTGSTWLTANLATSSLWTTINTYAVPLGTAIQVTPQNYLFFTLKDTGASAITAGNSRVVKANANATNTVELWSGPNTIFKDIGDALQRPYIRVPVTANASEQLLFQVYSLGTTLASTNSDVFLECMQFYAPVA